MRETLFVKKLTNKKSYCYHTHKTIKTEYISDCFDPWLEEIKLNGETYERTRPMSSTQDITGTFSCRCRYGRIRCSG